MGPQQNDKEFSWWEIAHIDQYSKGNGVSRFIHVINRLNSLNIYPSTVQELTCDTDTQTKTKSWPHP